MQSRYIPTVQTDHAEDYLRLFMRWPRAVIEDAQHQMFWIGDEFYQNISLVARELGTDLDEVSRRTLETRGLPLTIPNGEYVHSLGMGAGMDFLYSLLVFQWEKDIKKCNWPVTFPRLVEFSKAAQEIFIRKDSALIGQKRMWKRNPALSRVAGLLSDFYLSEKFLEGVQNGYAMLSEFEKLDEGKIPTLTVN